MRRRPKIISNPLAQITFLELQKRAVSIYGAFGYVQKSKGIDANALMLEAHQDGIGVVRMALYCLLGGHEDAASDKLETLVDSATALRTAGDIEKAVIVTDTSFPREIISRLTLPFLRFTDLPALQEEVLSFARVYQTHVSDYENDDIFSLYVSASAKQSTLGLITQDITDSLDQKLCDLLQHERPSTYIILADFGGGKTTLLRHIYYKLAKTAIKNVASRQPIFAELKNFHRYASIRDYMLASLPTDVPRQMTEARLEYLLSSGRFAFLLDGFDEIRLEDFERERAKAFLEIRSFLGDRSPLVVSCRPTYFTTESELRTFLKYATESRKRLTARLYGHTNERKAADRFLDTVRRKKTSDLSGRPLQVYIINEFDEEKIRKYIDGFRQRPGGCLVYDTRTLVSYLNAVYDISDLIKRPLLLHIILEMIEKKKINPESPDNLGGAAEIYSLYIQYCIEREHDKGRQIFSELEKKALCQHLAVLLFRSNSMRASWHDIIDYITMEPPIAVSLHKRILTHSIHEMSSDIRLCSFLKLDEGDTLKFAHKSFMEFLIAQYIYEYNGAVIDNNALFLTLSYEILFFVAQFAKFRYSFGERICNDRIFKPGVKRPKKLDQQQFETLRRNLFVVNILSNHRSEGVAIDGLTLEWLRFAGIRLVRLSIRDSRVMDTSFLDWDAAELQFTKCKMKNVEFNDIKTKRFHLSGDLTDVKAASFKVGYLYASLSSGVASIDASTIDALVLENEGSGRTLVSESTVGHVSTGAPGDGLDFRKCCISQLSYRKVLSEKEILRAASKISFRECRGELKGILFGRLCQNTLRHLEPEQGLFVLDTEVWDRRFKRDPSAFIVERNVIYVKQSGLSQLEKELTPDSPASVKSTVGERACKAMEAILHSISVNRSEHFPETRDRGDLFGDSSKSPHTFFFSYARKNAERAYHIVDELRRADFSVWVDTRLAAGLEWDSEIEFQIAYCKAFIVMLTPESVTNGNVRNEIDFALKRGKRILPLVMEDCEVPMALGRLQEVDGRRGINAIVEACNSLFV